MISALNHQPLMWWQILIFGLTWTLKIKEICPYAMIAHMRKRYKSCWSHHNSPPKSSCVPHSKLSLFLSSCFLLTVTRLLMKAWSLDYAPFLQESSVYSPTWDGTRTNLTHTLSVSPCVPESMGSRPRLWLQMRGDFFFNVLFLCVSIWYVWIPFSMYWSLPSTDTPCLLFDSYYGERLFCMIVLFLY